MLLAFRFGPSSTRIGSLRKRRYQRNSRQPVGLPWCRHRMRGSKALVRREDIEGNQGCTQLQEPETRSRCCWCAISRNQGMALPMPSSKV